MLCAIAFYIISSVQRSYHVSLDFVNPTSGRFESVVTFLKGNLCIYIYICIGNHKPMSSINVEMVSSNETEKKGSLCMAKKRTIVY